MNKLTLIILLIWSSTMAKTTFSTDSIAPLCNYGIHEKWEDFKEAQIKNLDYKDTRTGFTLSRTSAGNYVPEGQIISPIYHSSFVFDTFLLSWNGNFPKDTYATIEVQIRGRSFFWSPWYELATYGDITQHDNHMIKTSWAGTVDVDQLRMDTQGHHFRYRITLYTRNPKVSPSLRMVSYSYANYAFKHPVKDLLTIPQDTAKGYPAWVKDLNVPYRSQMHEDKDISYRACHPTSLSMVLEYYGKSLKTQDVAWNVWDNYNELFGNWTYNAAYASQLGMKSYVRYCDSFDPIKEEVAQGRPVIISIRFRKGTLKNSPISSTAGHIIVVQGFSPNGDPICNDPAAKDKKSGHIVYAKEELEQAWLKHSGAVVFVQPLK